MFERVLIANRGEIAARIIRTLRELGVRSVLAASVPDRHGLAARMADEVVLLEGSEAGDTYLDVERILAAAKFADCDAVHPGYGFLSESPLLAEACAREGIVFIGPSVVVLQTLGDKSAARKLAVENNVPVVLGWDGDGGIDELVKHASSVGFPLMLKARGGGGGRGMRRVDSAAELVEAAEGAAREAQAAFGDGRIFMERVVQDAHHVEVQVLADQHGSMVHLGERDCSVQRRHQKIIEETPSPIVDDALRQRLTEAALTLMKAAGYVNVGTVEFLVGPEEDGVRPFYFMEVNPRLQVEHTVTEEVTGLDIVDLQLRIASGEPLPFVQEDVQFDGHAIEFRVNAEDPFNDFRPSSGRLDEWRWEPFYGPRVDAGFEDGDRVVSQYDSLLAKLVSHSETRADSIDRATEALRPWRISGVETNIALQSAICRSEAFASGTHTIMWLESEIGALVATARTEDKLWAAAAVAFVFRLEAMPSRWIGAGADRVTISDGQEVKEMVLDFSPRGEGAVFVGGSAIPFRTQSPSNRPIEEAFPEVQPIGELLVGDPLETVGVMHEANGEVDIYAAGDFSRFRLVPPPPLPRRIRAGSAGASAVTAPLAGTIGAVSVEVGQEVEAGDLLLVVEAMKMEHRVTAPSDGTVSELHVKTGQVVGEGDELVVLG